MSSFDLIPAEYHQQLWWRTTVRKFAIALAVCTVICALGYAALYTATQAHLNDIQALQNKKHISEQQRQQLTALTQEEQKLRAHLEFLDGLRGGVSESQVFESVDRALSGGRVWFRAWKFRRAGTAVKAGEPQRSNGYFIIAPSSQDNPVSETWQIETHMDLRGFATDHEALSAFVDQLYQQREVRDVRILDTTLGRVGEGIDFNLVVVIDNRAGAAS